MRKKVIMYVIIFIGTLVAVGIVLMRLLNINSLQDIRNRASSEPDQYTVTQTINPGQTSCSEFSNVHFDVVRIGGNVSTTNPIDVVLTLDVSNSMTSAGGNPPEPLHSAKEAAKQFLNLLSFNNTNTTDRVALVTFNRTARLVLPLTNDKNQLINAIDNAAVGDYTNTPAGLATSVQELTSNARANIPHVIVLLSDGLPNHKVNGSACTDWPTTSNTCTQEAITIAQSATANNIDIYSIGLGFDAVNIDHPGSGTLGRSVMQSIASAPENYFDSPTYQDLSQIYQTIASIVNDIVSSTYLQVILNSQLTINTSGISPPPDSINGNTLRWDWSTLTPGDSLQFSVPVSNNQAQTVQVVENSSKLSYVEYDNATRDVSWQTNGQLTTSGAQCVSEEISNTPANTLSPTVSSQATPTDTIISTPTNTPLQSTITQIPNLTSTPTDIPPTEGVVTNTPASTASPYPTNTPSIVPSNTPTRTPTSSPNPSNTVASYVSQTPYPTNTNTYTPNSTSAPTPSQSNSQNIAYTDPNTQPTPTFQPRVPEAGTGKLPIIVMVSLALFFIIVGFAL